MTDSFDVAISDDDLLAELRLMVALIVTANATPRRLSTQEVDDVLGLDDA